MRETDRESQKNIGMTYSAALSFPMTIKGSQEQEQDWDCRWIKLLLMPMMERLGRKIGQEVALSFGLLSLGKREVWISPQETTLSLTPLENKLLEHLMINAGQVVTVEMIIDRVWGPSAADRDMLRQLVHRLRVKIEPNPQDPVYIQTVPGLGCGFLD